MRPRLTSDGLAAARRITRELAVKERPGASSGSASFPSALLQRFEFLQRKDFAAAQEEARDLLAQLPVERRVRLRQLHRDIVPRHYAGFRRVAMQQLLQNKPRLLLFNELLAPVFIGLAA